MAQATRMAKIMPIPKTFDPSKQSTANSFLKHGFHRQPGAALTCYPVRLPDGRYLTGLDEKAPSVLAIIDKAAREIEQKNIVELRTSLEEITALDLGPRSNYYSKISQANRDGIYTDVHSGAVTKVAKPYRLQDGKQGNVFNFVDPMQQVTFLWVSQHPSIASSLEDYKSGNAKPSCQFYICNPELEADIIYKEKQEQTKCVVELQKASLEKRKRVAKLLGLLVSNNDREQDVFIMLDDFIKSGQITTGEFKGYRAIALFKQMMDLKDNILEARVMIKDALTLGIYRLKNKAVYEGPNTQVAESVEALLNHLLSSAGTEEYLALDAKIQNKRGITK